MPTGAERHLYRLTYSPAPGNPVTSVWMAELLRLFKNAGINISELFAHCGCGPYAADAYGPVTVSLIFHRPPSDIFLTDLKTRYPGAELQPLA